MRSRLVKKVIAPDKSSAARKAKAGTGKKYVVFTAKKTPSAVVDETIDEQIVQKLPGVTGDRLVQEMGSVNITRRVRECRA